jgi:FlaA1/EpsC-like NDP-sugar epimerase
MSNVLIIGITGFFGRNLTKALLNKNFNVFGCAHSESRFIQFKKKYPNIKIYLIELSSSDLFEVLDNIVVKNKIEYIIHAGAMKHVDICQQFPEMAIKVNSDSINSIIKVADKNKIKNLIGISTDKANNPCNVYGMSKLLMMNKILENNYSIFQGVNFFWSDGSVLDIWFNAYIHKKPLVVRNVNHIRYFNNIESVCELIIKNLDNKGTIIYPEYAYQIKLEDLLNAFSESFNYHNHKFIGEYSFEKIVDEISDTINIIKFNKDDIKKLISTFYNNLE